MKKSERVCLLSAMFVMLLGFCGCNLGEGSTSSALDSNQTQQTTTPQEDGSGSGSTPQSPSEEVNTSTGSDGSCVINCAAPQDGNIPTPPTLDLGAG